MYCKRLLVILKNAVKKDAPEGLTKASACISLVKQDWQPASAGATDYFVIHINFFILVSTYSDLL